MNILLNIWECLNFSKRQTEQKNQFRLTVTNTTSQFVHKAYSHFSVQFLNTTINRKKHLNDDKNLYQFQ